MTYYFAARYFGNEHTKKREPFSDWLKMDYSSGILKIPEDIGGIFAIFSEPVNVNKSWHYRRINLLMFVIPEEKRCKADILEELAIFLDDISQVIAIKLQSREYAAKTSANNKIVYSKEVLIDDEETEIVELAQVLYALRKQYFGPNGAITNLLINHVNFKDARAAKWLMDDAGFNSNRQIQGWLEHLLAGIEEDAGDCPCYNPQCFNRVERPLQFCDSCLHAIPKIIRNRRYATADEEEFTDVDDTDRFDDTDRPDDADRSDDRDHSDDGDYSLDFSTTSEQSLVWLHNISLRSSFEHEMSGEES